MFRAVDLRTQLQELHQGVDKDDSSEESLAKDPEPLVPDPLRSDSVPPRWVPEEGREAPLAPRQADPIIDDQPPPSREASMYQNFCSPGVQITSSPRAGAPIVTNEKGAVSLTSTSSRAEVGGGDTEDHKEATGPPERPHQPDY